MADNAPVQPASSTQNDNVMAAVATIPLVGLIIYFGMKNTSDFVKLYAKQGTGLFLLGLLISVATTVTGFIPLINVLVAIVGGLAGFVLFIAWLILLINALQGTKYRLPVLADMVDQLIK